MNSYQDRKAEGEGLAWHLVNTNGHAERLAKMHLERQGFAVYLPMRPVAKKAAQHAAPFFPRYLFVQVDLGAPRWDRIRTTIGVQSFVRVTGGIARVPESFITRLRAREQFGLIVLEDAQVDLPKCDLVAGEPVRVTGGQFEGVDAVFDRRCSDARRVAILLQVFGRPTRASVPLEHVRRAST